jgi:hypothetical protein
MQFVGMPAPLTDARIDMAPYRTVICAKAIQGKIEMFEQRHQIGT